jgi:hypothetical protein
MINMLLETEHFHMMDWTYDLFGPLSRIFMVSGGLIFVALSVFIAYYVHKDAIRRGIKNSEFWLVIGLIFNLLGLLLYLIVRSNYRIDA